jgi:nucleoside-diphosphate-sugar epimerase
MAQTVVVTAASGPLGRRVCQRAAADPDVDRVVAVDRPGTVPVSPERVAGAGADGHAVIEHQVLGLDDPEMKRLCEGASALVLLEGGQGPAEVGATRTLLDTVSTAGVPTLVVLSSATVYGAWPGNPVPLTEAAPLRPVPALGYAVERGEIERLASAWRDGQPGTRTVAVLRPAITIGPGQTTRLGSSPWPRTVSLRLDDEAPVQFVHIDDVAAAVDVARRGRLDGPFNVAPDGWLAAEARRDLRGPSPRLALPAPVAERIASFRWRLGLTGVSPGVLPYTMHPWVVANDRLKAAGWAPTHSNEEAFVEANPGGPLTRVHPRRRQVLSLVALAAPVVVALAVAAVIVRRVLRFR